MNKKYILLMMAIMLALVLCAASLYNNTHSKKTVSEGFKVVGYYSGDLFNEPVERLQTDKLTHIMYSFIIPKTDGTLHNLKNPNQLTELVQKAHRDGAQVFISLGGWSYEGEPLEPVFRELAKSGIKRKTFIDNVCKMVEEYSLDGVELDWEHPNKSTAGDYERLVIEMSDALEKQGRELTAALNGSWYEDWAAEDTSVITEECLKRFSFINVMSYDMNNADHSPMWFFENSLKYWLNRGMPPEKIVMGLPLYAKPSWKQYRHLVAENPEYAYLDYAPTAPLESYYNGMNTLKEKLLIAMERAGGVMLFDINEDTNDETSIVSMIDNLLQRVGNMRADELKKHITVVIDNRELVFSDDSAGTPFIYGSVVMIPLKKSMEYIGSHIDYDEKTQIITVQMGGTTVKLKSGEKFIHINEKKIKTDAVTTIKEGTAYVPLKDIFMAFGYKTEWHASSRTSIVSNK